MYTSREQCIRVSTLVQSPVNQLWFIRASIELALDVASLTEVSLRILLLCQCPQVSVSSQSSMFLVKQTSMLLTDWLILAFGFTQHSTCSPIIWQKTHARPVPSFIQCLARVHQKSQQQRRLSTYTRTGRLCNSIKRFRAKCVIIGDQILVFQILHCPYVLIQMMDSACEKDCCSGS